MRAEPTVAMGDVVFAQLVDVSHKSRSRRSFSLQQKEELTLQCKQVLQVSAACHRPGSWEANSVETHIEVRLSLKKFV